MLAREFAPEAWLLAEEGISSLSKSRHSGLPLR